MRTAGLLAPALRGLTRGLMRGLTNGHQWPQQGLHCVHVALETQGRFNQTIQFDDLKLKHTNQTLDDDVSGEGGATVGID